MSTSNFTESNSTFYTSDESKIIGIIYLTLSLICVVPYVTILKVIISNKYFTKHYAYIIMIQLGILDLGELVFYYGVFSMMLITNTHFPLVITKVWAYHYSFVIFRGAHQ